MDIRGSGRPLADLTDQLVNEVMRGEPITWGELAARVGESDKSTVLLRASRRRAFTQCAIVATPSGKADVPPPEALVFRADQLSKMASSPRLWQLALHYLRAKSTHLHSAGELKTVFKPAALKSAFGTAVNRALASGTLPVGIGAVLRRGHFYLLLQDDLLTPPASPRRSSAPSVRGSATGQPPPLPGAKARSGPRNRPLTSTNNKPLTSPANKPLTGSSLPPLRRAPASSSRPRPVSSPQNQPLSSAQNRPLSSAQNRPLSSAQNRPLSSAQNRPVSSAQKRPLTGHRNRPLSGVRNRPLTGARPDRAPSVPGAPSPASDAFADAFEREFTRLDAETGRKNFVKLLSLRQALSQFPRAVFDHELNALRRAGRFSLDAAEGTHDRTTPEEREAGVVEAGRRLLYCARR